MVIRLEDIVLAGREEEGGVEEAGLAPLGAMVGDEGWAPRSFSGDCGGVSESM